MDFKSFTLAAVTAELSEEPWVREDADIVEFRMDLATDPLDMLNEYAGDLPVIATNRVNSQGGGAADTPERLATLRSALEHPRVTAVDIELPTVLDGNGQEMLELARELGATVIVSAHDFEHTPPPNEMERVLTTAHSHGDIAKLATTAHNRQDALDLLTVTHTLTADGKSIATMAMGQPGRHTRAVAPIYGSRISYAPLRAQNATAPGQYELATLRTLIDGLL